MTEPINRSTAYIPNQEGVIVADYLADGAVHAKLGGPSIAATGAIAAGRFVDVGFATADPQAVDVAGVAPFAIASGDPLILQSSGVVAVQADEPISIGDVVKVGSGGRAALYKSLPITIAAAATGVASSFTQTNLPDKVQIHSVSNQATHRGRSVTVVGLDAGGDPQTEVITLNATNSSTVVTGLLTFSAVYGAYSTDGDTFETADVQVEDDTTNTDICVITAGDASVGQSDPDETNSHNGALNFVADTQTATFVIVEGYKSSDPDTIGYELYTFDNAATASEATSSTQWRLVTRLWVGGYEDGSATVLSTIQDTRFMQLGQAVSAANLRTDVFGLMFYSNLGLPLPASTPLKISVVDGEDETSTHKITVTGMAAGDEIVKVLVLTTKASIATLAAHAGTFTAATDKITPGTEVDNTNNQYIIFCNDLT